jgi:hypothetical protein
MDLKGRDSRARFSSFSIYMSPAAVHNVERRLRGPAKQALDGSVTSLLLVADVSVRACRAFHTRKLNDLASSLGSP